MTIDDRDLERALTALADDGYPASTDLDGAYREFQARTSRAEQRRRVTRLAVAAGVAGILGVGGLLAYQQVRGGEGRDELQPATPTTSTTQLISQQDLEGIWAVEADWLYSGFPWLWTFNPDGSASGSPHADTTDNTWVYTLSGNNVGARDRPGSCQYSWRVASFDQGAMTFDVLVHCGNTGPGIALTRLSPRLTGRDSHRHAPHDGRHPATRGGGRRRRLAHAGERDAAGHRSPRPRPLPPTASTTREPSPGTPSTKAPSRSIPREP